MSSVLAKGQAIHLFPVFKKWDEFATSATKMLNSQTINNRVEGSVHESHSARELNRHLNRTCIANHLGSNLYTEKGNITKKKQS